MLERFTYLLRRSLTNMRQSPFLCFASVGTVAFSLAILALFAIVVINVQQLTSHWSEEVQVIAYLDKIPEERVLQGWIDRIENLPEVDGVTYVSRQEAFNRFGKRLEQEADLLRGVEPDILPASLEVRLKESHRSRATVEQVVSHLRRDLGLSDLRYGQEWLERFESFLLLLQVAGAVLGGFLLFATLFIVANTIKLTLYARREELEIMALVGGTPWFIKTPFLLEGALQGALGGILALGGSYGLFQFVLQKGLGAVLTVPGIADVVFLSGTQQLLLVGTGVFLGSFGSLVSLRKLVRI